MRSHRLLALSFVGLLTGCTSTSVVLLPDPEGNVGAVDVITEGGTTVLDKAYESAEAGKKKQPPAHKVQLTNETVNAKYGGVLAKEPMAPEHYQFYFKTGKAKLRPEARQTLQLGKTRIEERKSCDFSIIGHSDRVYGDDYNYLLSMVRAQNIANALAELGVPQKCMDLRYYGESYPLVPTLDEVEEPRNRAVVLEIR